MLRISLVDETRTDKSEIHKNMMYKKIVEWKQYVGNEKEDLKT